ncbi:protein of unknown function [Hyphomicrobium sp. MC1]|nr:protein of unknown function [Hyphomicrobium sp. MC1]
METRVGTIRLVEVAALPEALEKGASDCEIMCDRGTPLKSSRVTRTARASELDIISLRFIPSNRSILARVRPSTDLARPRRDLSER